MDLELKGRTALVTGASAGIGTGVAECLAREGVRVALAGRNRSALEELAAKLRASGAPEPVVLTGDLASAKGAQDIANGALNAFGGKVDIVVNNAGGSRPLALQGEETEEFWEESYQLNFASARRITTAILPNMKSARWGRVMNVTGAIFGKAINAAGPAKAGLLAWSRALAYELGPYNITVNCIAPGRINSVQILERLHPTQQSRDAYIRDNIPAGRFGEPADMGNLITFLASPLAGYISGAHIPVDGGAVRIAP